MINDPGIVILAAGKGKRMGGIHPKVMFKLQNRPLIDYVVKAAGTLAPKKIVVVVGFGREKVIDYLNDIFSLPLEYAAQEQQLGTGHAVQQADKNFRDFNGSILVLNGDVPLISPGSLKEFALHHEKAGTAATVMSADYDNPFGYGRIIRNDAGNVLKIVEEKDASEEEKKIREVNTGTFMFKSLELFDNLSDLDSDNKQQEYYLTDMISILREKGMPVGAWKNARPEETFGVNTTEHLVALEKLLDK